MGEVKTTIRLTDQASSVLRNIANQANQTKSSMEQTGRAIDNAFKSTAPNTFATTAGNALNRISSSAEEVGNKVNNMFDDFDAGFADDIERGVRTAGDAVDEFADSADSAGRALDDVGSSAEDLGKTVDDIGRNNGLDDLENDANDAGNEMEDAAGKALTLEDALKKMAAAIGMAAIAKGVKDFVTDAINLGMDYSAMMSEVAAISGATGSEYEMLEQTAREYGSTTVFSASEAAEALKYMSLAGWDATQSASALGGVLDLAAASGMGLGEASDMVTDYLSAFGMTADQAGYFADLLAYAQANSNTSAQQLGEAFLNSAANMNAAGQDIETTTSLIEAMSNQGTKGARAGTQLAAIMRDITNEMENGAIKIGNTSIAVQDQYGNFRDLTDILTDVEAAVDGMGSAQKSAALATTFTADSTKGINQILTEGMHNIAQYEEELRNSANTASKTADIMNDNLKGDLASMNSAFEEMQLQVFEGMEGQLREGVQYVTNTVIPTLTDWIPEAISGVVDTISTIGNALKPAFEWLIKNPKTVGTALTAIGTGLLAFKAMTGISGIISGIGTSLKDLGTIVMNHPIITAAAAIAAAVILIKSAIDQYNEAMIQTSLETHFGTIELTTPQIEELADRIIDVRWVTNIELALGEFKNAEELRNQAEQALENNENLLWRASIQTVIYPEGEDVTGVISNLVDTIQASLDAHRENTGLKYRPFALIELNPSTETDEYGNQSIVQVLIDYANLAITGDTTELEKYTRDVVVAAFGVEPNSEEGDSLTVALVAAANAAITGDTTVLEEYSRDIAIALTHTENPDENLVGNIVGVVNAAITGDETALSEYSRNVAVALYADFGAEGEGNASLVANLVDTVNAAIAGDETGLETYSRNVAIALTHNTNPDENLVEAIINVANAAITGDHEKLSDFEDDVLVYLTPDEGGRFMRALSTLTLQTVSKKLSFKPTYKDTLSVVLTPEMQEEYKANIEAYLQGKVAELNSLTLATKESMEAVLGEKAGSAIISQVKSWAAEDSAALDTLSSSLTTLVENALKDGVLDVEEQAAIDILQQKINNILTGWRQGQADAEWDLLQTKWSGADLTDDSFMSLVEAMHTQRESAISALDADTVEMFSVFNAWQNSGRISSDQNVALHDLWNQNYLNMEAESIARGMSFAINTLFDTYQDTINQNIENLGYDQNTGRDAMERINELSQDMEMNYLEMFNALGSAADLYVSQNKDSNTQALARLFESMEPDVAVMEGLIDKYRETGAQIPQALSDAFNSAMEIAAASGSTEYKWESFANAIVASGSSELIDVITNPENEFYTMVPEALRDAVERALYLAENSTEDVDMSEFFNSILGLEDGEVNVDMAKVAEILESIGIDISEYIAEHGIEIDSAEVSINAEVTAAEDESNLYMKVRNAANELKERAQAVASSFASTIFHNMFMTTTITNGSTTDNTTPATSQTQTGTVEITLTGTDNAAEVYEKVGQNLATAFGVTIDTDGSTDITLTETDNTADIYKQVGDNLATAFGVTFEQDGTTNITLTETDNVGIIYAQVGSALETAFATPFTVYGTVDAWLTVNYNIANPTKNILFGGDATGTGTITTTLYAEGGLVTEPELAWIGEAGYPEYIIPMNGSSDSLAMWREAGEMLGAFDNPIQTLPAGDNSNSGGIQGSRDINLNINGSGSIQVQGGVSREAVADYILENLRDHIINMIEEEILTEGEGAYAY